MEEGPVADDGSRLARALQWLMASAEAGYPPAMAAVGQAILNGSLGLPRPRPAYAERMPASATPAARR
eukprot:2007517-Prymnesium_polylepis.1